MRGQKWPWAGPAPKVEKRCVETVVPNWRALSEVLSGIKSVPCMDCGQTFDPACMDFDHARGKKSFTISNAVERAGRRWQEFLDEIAKCDVVCSNCHRIRTKRRRREGHGS